MSENSDIGNTENEIEGNEIEEKIDRKIINVLLVYTPL